MLKIWGRVNSSNVRKALWVAEEAGVPYESLNAGGAFGIVKEAEYRAKNPNSQIPMIEDGDFILWESNTIVRYIAAKYSPGNLYPDDLQERAAADKWMDWFSANFYHPFRDVFWPVIRTPADQQDWVAINKAILVCEEQLKIVNEVLSRQPYLSGDHLGIGDIPLGSFIYAWFEMPIERTTELTHLRAWYERLKSRPAYQKSVMTPLT